MAKKTKARKASKPKRAKEKRDFLQVALAVAEKATESTFAPGARTKTK